MRNLIKGLFRFLKKLFIITAIHSNGERNIGLNNFFLINIGGTNIPDTINEEESIADVRPFDELEFRRETERTIKKSYKFAKRSINLSL